MAAICIFRGLAHLQDWNAVRFLGLVEPKLLTYPWIRDNSNSRGLNVGLMEIISGLRSPYVSAINLNIGA